MRKKILAIAFAAAMLAGAVTPALAAHDHAGASVGNVPTVATDQTDAANAGNAGSGGAEGAADGTH